MAPAVSQVHCGGPGTDSLAQGAPQVLSSHEGLQAPALEESLAPPFTQPGTEIM